MTTSVDLEHIEAQLRHAEHAQDMVYDDPRSTWADARAAGHEVAYWREELSRARAWLCDEDALGYGPMPECEL